MLLRIKHHCKLLVCIFSLVIVDLVTRWISWFLSHHIEQSFPRGVIIFCYHFSLGSSILCFLAYSCKLWRSVYPRPLIIGSLLLTIQYIKFAYSESLCSYISCPLVHLNSSCVWPEKKNRASTYIQVSKRQQNSFFSVTKLVIKP